MSRLRAKSQEFLELNSIEAIAGLVRDGLGVALLPLLDGRGWQADARLGVVKIPPAVERREMALVQLRATPKAAVIAAIGHGFAMRAATADVR